jgi:hypothetical protein
MRRCLLFCKLVEKPSIRLYYKGLENDSKIAKALNVIIGLTPKDAVALDEYTAKKLCQELNQDRDVLLKSGFTEFEILIHQ